MNYIHDKTKELFNKYIRNKNLRDTKQREEILDIFLTTEKHITAEQLYGTIRTRNPAIGFATVYRTLKLMCEAGLANEIKIGKSKGFFEHNFGREHHDHLICTKCGRFIEIRSEAIEKLQDKIAQKNGFAPRKHRLEIFGLCKSCK